MIVGLNVPTASRIGRELLDDIASFQFTHVRTDVPASGDLRPFVQDYANGPITPLFLLHDVVRNAELLDHALDLLGPEGFWLQIWNEPPQFDHVDLPTYTEGILAVYDDSRSRGFTGPILMGGMGNPDASNRRWIAKALESMPFDIFVDEHRYAYKTQDDWSRPWRGYRSRSDENTSLSTLAEGRPIVRTEIGWHTAVEHVGWIPPFGYDTQLTDEQALTYLVKDLILYDADGLDAVFPYQLNDGFGDSWGERQGIRHPNTDGTWTWKPQAECVRWYRAQYKQAQE